MFDTIVAIQVQEEPPRLVLVRAGQRWGFQWDRGSEHALIEHVAELARSEDCPFGWLDAAVVCHHLGRRTHPTQQSPTVPS